MGRGKHNKRKTPDSTEYGITIVPENQQFERYYRDMNICPPEEFQQMMSSFKLQLPSTFRICISTGFSNQLRDRMINEFSKPLPDETEEVKSKRPFPISWYPDNLGWCSLAAKRELRDFPALAKYRQFLINEHDKGNLNRQEAVSMIPALFLDVQPHHKVLDMCAAPGSKTAQLLEYIQQNDKSSIHSGIVLANDVDYNRAFMLVHQTKRLGSPNFLVTTHQAQFFPTLFLPHPNGGTRQIKFLFDRILADVPCSGDGTLRKQPDIWRKWYVGFGAGLHKLQLDIALRGVAMLKPGGLMVYSTCSLNPLEDEAVVAELVRRGDVELVDVSDKFPLLKRRQGLSSWKVFDWKNDEYFDKFEDVEKNQRDWLRKSFFCPTEEEQKEFHLDRCMRVLPHMQDTGGFFISLLRKKEKSVDTEVELNEEVEIAEIEIKNDEAVETVIETEPEAKAPKVEIDDEARHEFMPLTGLSPLPLKFITEFFGLKEDFPFFNIFTRSEAMKKLYMIGDETANLFLNKARNSRLRVAHAGLRVFERIGKPSDDLNGVEYRICQEGIDLLIPYLTKQLIYAETEDFVKILKNPQCLHGEFQTSFRKQIEAQGLGCCIVILTGDIAAQFGKKVAVTAWKTPTQFNVMVSKSDRQSMLNLITPENETEVLETTYAFHKTVVAPAVATETKSEEVTK